MNTQQSAQNSTHNYSRLFTWDGRPLAKEIAPMSLQHLFAMIVGTISPAMIISGVVGADSALKASLIQASLIFSGLTTLLMVFGLSKYVGARLPVIMGISFAYVPTMINIGENYGLGAIFGAQLIGAFVVIVFGMFLKYLLILFDPVVTGTVILSIGLSLYPVAIKYMAGGAGNPDFGHPLNWLIGIITMITVFIISNFGKGIFKLSAILIGLIVGYILALILNKVQFSGIYDARWFATPVLMLNEVRFEISSIISMCILFIVNAVQAIGDLSATTIGGMNRIPTNSELSGGIVGYGISNMIGACFGSFPTATFSQNVGIVTVTRVINKLVFACTAVLLLLAGFIPKFAAVLTTIPAAALGGATISVFGTISMSGVRLITRKSMTPRTVSIVGLSLALGLGVTRVPESLALLPRWVGTVFGSNPVILASLTAILLNIILPKQQQKNTTNKTQLPSNANSIPTSTATQAQIANNNMANAMSSSRVEESRRVMSNGQNISSQANQYYQTGQVKDLNAELQERRPFSVPASTSPLGNGANSLKNTNLSQARVPFAAPNNVSPGFTTGNSVNNSSGLGNNVNLAQFQGGQKQYLNIDKR